SQRFFAGWAGSGIAFSLFAITYLILVTTDEAISLFIGLLALSFLAGVPTIFYRTDRLYKAAMFGGGAGFIIVLGLGMLLRAAGGVNAPDAGGVVDAGGTLNV